jgi:TolB-like protein
VLLFAIDCAIMQRCRRTKKLPAKSTDTVTVAVLDYLNVMNDPKLEPLVRGIPDSLAAHLTRRGRVRIIQRDRLEAALKELGLSMRGFIDESSAAQVGCAVDADAVIKGSLLKIEEVHSDKHLAD